MPERGEVWQVDFGIAQKVRPALIISIPYAGADRALIDVIPHTTGVRGSPFEISISARFLGEGAFLVQGIQALSPRYFILNPAMGLAPRPPREEVIKNPTFTHWVIEPD